MKFKYNFLTVTITLAIAIFVVAQTPQDLQNELANLTQDLTDLNYTWLVNYSLQNNPNPVRIEIYEENKTEIIAKFENITENEYNKVYLTGLNGTQDTFDLKIINGNLQFDHIIDPITSIESSDWITTSLLTNVTAESGASNFTHLTIDDPNLVLYMPFDVNGTTQYDYTANGNDGTVTNATWNATGKYGGAISFDGDGDYVDCGNDSSLNLIREMTIGAWVKIDNGTGSKTIISKTGPANENTTFWMDIRTSDTQLWFGGYTSSGTLTSRVANFNFIQNKWYYIVGVDDGTDYTLYIDGTNLGSGSSSERVSGNWSVSIGNRGGTNGNHFNGTIDEVAIFNRSLNSTEIADLYNRSYSKFFPTGTNKIRATNITTTTNWDDAGYNRVNLSSTIQEESNSSIEARIGQINSSVDVDGLVLYMPFEWGSAVDISGKGNDGTITDAVFNLSGGVNDTGAFEFDGDGDYINCGNDNSLDVTSNITIETWINLATLPVDEGRTIVKRADRSQSPEEVQYWFSINQNGYMKFWAKNSSGSWKAFTDDQNTVGLNEWHHVVAVFSGGTVYFYLDGSSSDSGSLGLNSLVTSDGILSIGGGFYSGGSVPGTYFFNGTIDEVAIYNRSLTPAEIQTLYNDSVAKHNNVYYTDYQNITSDTNETFTINPEADFIFPEYKFLAGNSTNPFYSPVLYNDLTLETFSLDVIFPQINFTSPTPTNDTTTSDTSIEINVSIMNASDLDEIKYNWDGTNYTLFNDSLVLMMNFDNVSALGENSTHVVDVSGHCYDDETEILTRVEVGCESGKLSEEIENDVKNEEKKKRTVDNIAPTAMQISTDSNCWKNNNYINLSVNGNVAEYAPVASMVMHPSQKRGLHRLSGSIPDGGVSAFNLSKCYNYSWKYFVDLDETEEVATLNQKTGELEWELPREWQEFESDGEMFRVETEDGDLVVSEKHRVYSSLADKEETSNLFSYNVMNLPSKSSSLISLSNFENELSNASGLSCGILNQTIANMVSLWYNNSSVKSQSLVTNILCSELEYSASLPFESPLGLEIISNPCCVRNTSNLLLTFSSLRNLGVEGNAELDIVSAFGQVSNVLKSCQDVCFSYGRIVSEDFVNAHSSPNHFKDLPEHDSCACECQFSVTNLRIRDNELVDFDSHGLETDDEIFKSFSLQNITDVYSDFENGDDIYFLDSNNQPVRVTGIERIDYEGKIYDVDVGNDVVLVRRNELAVWSGNSNNGTGTFNGTGGMTASGKYDRGVYFDGDGDYVDVGNDSSLNFGTGDLTVGLWVNLTAYASNKMFISKYDGGSVGWYFSLDTGEPFSKFFFKYGAGVERRLTSVSTLNLNTWEHIVFVHDADGKDYIYLNGVEDNTRIANNDDTDAIQNLRISSYVNGLFFNGSIDNVLIYNRSLSPSEISQLYMSNLNKYDTDKWLLYVNQSKNATTGLTDGTYTYQVSAKDTTGNENLTETRTINIDAVTPPTLTFVSPTESNDTHINEDYTFINATASEDNVSMCLVDESLVLGMHFESVNSSNWTSDFSGEGNDGELGGGDVTRNPTLTSSGKFGNALEFDGENDYVDVGNDGSLNIAGAITISTWVKPNPPSFVNILAKGRVYYKQDWTLHLTSNNLVNFGIGIGSSAGTRSELESNSQAPNNTWTNIVATWDGTTNPDGQKIYINGNLDASKASDIAVMGTDYNLRIGRDFYVDHADYFNGTIDEVRIYNRSLSPSEIASIYNASVGNYRQFEANRTGLPETEHTYYIEAIDQAGNINQSETRSITVDQTNPQINFTISTPSNGSTQTATSVYVNVTVNDSSESSAWIDWNRSLVGYWSFDSYNSTGVFDNSSYCYDDETEILTDEGWKLFKDLSKEEKVATLNSKTGETEFHKPTDYPEFESPEFMFRIETEEGDLVVSPEHKVYSKVEELKSSISSFVVNTSIDDCSLKCLSLDQIGEFVDNASARKSISLESEIEVLATSRNSSYSIDLKNLILDSTSCCLVSNSCTESFDLDRQSSLYFENSDLINSGAINFALIEKKICEVIEEGFIKENNTLLSNTNFIFYLDNFSLICGETSDKSFLNLPSFNFLPILTVQSVNPDSSSSCNLANIFSFHNNCLTFNSITPLTNPDQLISGNCFMCVLVSPGTDSVIDTILSVEKHKAVEVFKSFSLQNITEVYSDFTKDKKVYFLDSKNNPVKVKSITKENYGGKIYDVDVENDIVLVRRDNLIVWSGNSNHGTFEGGLGTGDLVGAKRGEGLSFDGVGDYVNVGNGIDLGSDALTVSVWVKYNGWGDVTSSSPYVSDWNTWSPDSQKGFLLRTYQDSQQPQFIVANGTNYYESTSSQSLSLDTWHYIVGVFEANITHKIYIDGIERGSGTAPNQYVKEASSPIYIGKSSINTGYFNGSIDEVKIFNRALSPEEINASYQAGTYRLQNNFTNLTEGDYTYQSYVIDQAGNLNQTEERTVTVNTDTCACGNLQAGNPIDCSSNCNIASCNIGTGITTINSGGIFVTGNLFGMSIANFTLSDGCNITLAPGVNISW